MKPAEIQDRLARIESIKHDGEAAHGAEEQLYMDFIEYISTAPNVPRFVRSKAKMVLSSQEIKFHRI